MSTGVGGTVTPGSGWKNSGTTQSISAKAATGYTFSGWTGSGTASYSGTNNPASVTMNGPITEAATFTKNPTPTPTPTPTPSPTPTDTPTPTATPAVQITIQTNPAGCSFAVDGTTTLRLRRFPGPRVRATPLLQPLRRAVARAASMCGRAGVIAGVCHIR